MLLKPGPDTRAALASVMAALGSHAYMFSNESQLHQGLAAALEREGIAFAHEHIAGPQDRFDFLCAGAVVVEVKVKGTLPTALRQVDRYCAREDVAAALLVTTCAWGRSDALAQVTLHGKPVRMLAIKRMAF